MEPSEFEFNSGLTRHLLARMFKYCSATEPTDQQALQHADAVFVFGRADGLLARRAALLCLKGLAIWALVTGGKGKDSGKLTVPEADFLADLMAERGVTDVIRETLAENGGDNCRNGLDAIAKSGRPCRSLIVVADPVSVRRLTMMLRGEIAKRGLAITLQSVGTGRIPVYTNAVHALEIVQEYLRLADWPAKYGYPENTDMDPWLVAFARVAEVSLKELVAA